MMKAAVLTVVIALSGMCYAAPAVIEYEGEVPEGFYQTGPAYEQQQTYQDEMLRDPSYDQSVPNESPGNKPDYLNALYGRDYDPHFSDTEELHEMMRSYRKRVGVSEEPFQLEPRQPLQSSAPCDHNHH